MAEATYFRNNALPYPIYGLPFTIVVPMFDADGDLVTGATTPDSEISKNGDTFADCTNEATEIATSSGMYYLTLTATEMTADIVSIIVKSATSGMKTTPIILYPRKLVNMGSGTSQGGDTGYITLAAGTILYDGQFNGCLIAATIDSNVECRIIQNSTVADQHCTVTPAWNVTPDADDTYVIYLPEGLQMPRVDVKTVGGSSQSVTDLKDFADTGYDPSTHKVAGVVLTDTCTTNSDMRGTNGALTDKDGFSLSATGADLILKSSTFVQAIVAAINELATYGLTALNTLLTSTGIKAGSIPDVTLAATQANYAPAKVGDKMDLIDAPNAIGLTALAKKVWDFLTADVTAAISSFGNLFKANINATISSRSSHSAADVWAVATRTLSGFGTLVSDIATAVWGATTRTLSAFEFTVATNSDTNVGAIKDVIDQFRFTVDNQVDANAITGGGSIDPEDIRNALGMEEANMDEQFAAIPTVEENQSGVAKTTDVTSATNTIMEAIDDLPTAVENREEMDSNSEILQVILDYIAILSPGTGPTEHIYTLEAPAGTPCADAKVLLSTDSARSNVIHEGRTNALGKVTFNIDVPVGTTVYLWRYKTGVNFVNPDVEVI